MISFYKFKDLNILLNINLNLLSILTLIISILKISQWLFNYYLIGVLKY